MLLDYFPSKAALDPSTGMLKIGATAQVFDRSDTALETPLTLLDLDGVSMGTTLESSSVGFYPDFRSPGHTQVVAVSGDHRTPLLSLYGLVLSVLPDPSTAPDQSRLRTEGGSYVLVPPGLTDLPDPSGSLDLSQLIVMDGVWTIGGPGGAGGRQAELGVSATHIQWRYVGDEAWQNLIALSELKGANGSPGLPGQPGQPGESPQMRVNGDWIQIKLPSQSSWTNLALYPPPGSMQFARYTGTAWPDRPTARTDVHVRWIGSTADNPPTAMLADDVHEYNA